MGRVRVTRLRSKVWIRFILRVARGTRRRSAVAPLVLVGSPPLRRRLVHPGWRRKRRWWRRGAKSRSTRWPRGPSLACCQRSGAIERRHGRRTVGTRPRQGENGINGFLLLGSFLALDLSLSLGFRSLAMFTWSFGFLLDCDLELGLLLKSRRGRSRGTRPWRGVAAGARDRRARSIAVPASYWGDRAAPGEHGVSHRRWRRRGDGSDGGTVAARVTVRRGLCRRGSGILGVMSVCSLERSRGRSGHCRGELRRVATWVGGLVLRI